MKLNVRKSIAAVGTAMALAVTPVAVPTMAPTAFAAEEEGDNTYSNLYKSTMTELKKLEQKLDQAMEKERNGKKVWITIEQYISDKRGEITSSAGETELDKAARSARDARSAFGSVSVDIKDLPEVGKKDSPEYGILQAAQKSITKANSDVDAAYDSISAADRAETKEADSAFKCDGATNYDSDNNKVKDGSTTSDLKSFFTSSGNRVVYKNGKKECVSNREYYTDMLTKLVAVLGTVLTLITTATKISDVVMKAAPAPAN